MKIPRSFPGTLAAFLLTLTAQTSPAQQTEPFLRGRLLAASCFQCHSSSGFDSITGKSPREIVSELREMRAKRKEIKIMDIVARAYTDQQIKEIAAYLATLPAGLEEDED